MANGYFLDFWGIPKGLKSNMSPMADFAIDIAHKKAAIPGSGDQLMTFTYTYDVARWAAAWLASGDKWDESTFIFGDKLSWNDFLKLAEEATGMWPSRTLPFSETSFSRLASR